YISTLKFSEIKNYDILLIPGGFGSRKFVGDRQFIENLKKLAQKSEFVLCVCTGSVLLAKTELLNGKIATSNKSSWDWVVLQNEKVNWVKNARWVRDGKFYSSSGVAAGMDMTLGFIADMHGILAARKIATSMEYIWNEDKNLDPFA
ncbi:MAG: DJ-1/PfpI family protein, partial [Campylobacter sp.]|nr:DJ-1/PfpI family protein [Campylobacter sp.]